MHQFSVPVDSHACPCRHNPWPQEKGNVCTYIFTDVHSAWRRLTNETPDSTGQERSLSQVAQDGYQYAQ